MLVTGSSEKLRLQDTIFFFFPQVYYLKWVEKANIGPVFLWVYFKKHTHKKTPFALNFIAWLNDNVI